MICCIPLGQLSGASPSPANGAIQLCSWACSPNMSVREAGGSGEEGEALAVGPETQRDGGVEQP